MPTVHPIGSLPRPKGSSYASNVWLVWRSLTPPSKIGKGSGEPRIIDLCHKQNSGSSNQISERNSYIIFVTSLQHTRAVRESGGWPLSVAEKRAALAAKKRLRGR